MQHLQSVRSRPVSALLLPLLLAAVLLTGLRGPAAQGVTAPVPTGSGVGTAAVGSGTTARAACASSGDYVWSHLSRCGWPGPGNTGPRPGRCPGDTLRARGHDPRSVIHVRTSGAVISCRRVEGCLSIEARDVTVRDVAVRCTTGLRGEAANGSGVIAVEDGASARVVHVATDGLRGVHACVWHQGVALVVRALDCHGVDDGIFSWPDTGYSRSTGDHFTIRDSWLHDFTTRTANGHVDGYQTEGAAHGLIAHNTFLMTTDDGNGANSAVAIWDERRDSHDITVRHNLIAGGGFSVYAHDYSPSEADPTGGYSVSDTHFVDNVFSRRLFGCVGYYGVWFPRGRPTDGWHRTGNTVLETGAGIDGRNPTYQGRTCS